MPEVELLDKTEVWVRGVTLHHVDLAQLASAAAAALELTSAEVFVTDARERHVVFDVLRPRIELTSIVGREAELLAAIGGVSGVTIDGDATVHSSGVMGVIGTPREDVETTLTRASETDRNLREYVSKRVGVISTGPEVVAGDIVDTNAARIKDILEPEGYEVSHAGAVLDDEAAITGRVLRLVSDGFGLVITTGGVGAESKDRTIEALQRVDPQLATAVLATYAVGHGRHAKPEVRVGVGQVQWTRIVALPGPTREVDAALPVIVQGLGEGWSLQRLADELAVAIRACMR